LQQKKKGWPKITKRLEEFFNLPPSDEPVVEPDYPVKTKKELFEEAQQIYSSLSTAEKVDIALPTVTDLETHDQEMDEIAKKAVDTFNDLIALGGNVPDIHAGKIYEVAGQMLKTALDAKNAKAERKLKMIELQLKKVRAEQIDFENGNGKSKEGSGGDFDRNELLKYIVSNKTEKTDK
jgi:hypothetical protein